MNIVPIGTLPAGTMFEYETKIDGKPYTAVGKVLAHMGHRRATLIENEHGNTQTVSNRFEVTPE